MDAHQSNGTSLVVYRYVSCASMTCLFLTSLSLTCLSLTGCITPDPSVELLEGELRWMEDQLYMMEDQLEQRCQELVACQASKNGQPCDCQQSPTPAASPLDSVDYGAHVEDQFESGSKRRDRGERSIPRKTSGSDTLPMPSAESLRNQNREIPQLLESPDRSRRKPAAASGDGLDLDTRPPQVDLGTEVHESGTTDGDAGSGSLGDDDLEELLNEPVIQYPEPEPAPRGVRPELESAGPDGSSGTVAPLILSEKVKRLQLNAARVSLHEDGADQEKLLVVVEPQSQNNRYVEMSAPVRVVLEDVDHGGIYFSSWEFSALETGRTLRESKMGQGIHLALDWPDDVPLLDDLRVSVVYRRTDGGEVRADKMLHPTAPVTTVAGWVPVVRSRKQDGSTAIEGDAEPTKSTDPFDLAEQTALAQSGLAQTGLAQSALATAPHVFKTVPIGIGPIETVAESKSSVTASWSQPIPSGPADKRATQRLTPIADVQLEPVRDASKENHETMLETIPVSAAVADSKRSGPAEVSQRAVSQPTVSQRAVSQRAAIVEPDLATPDFDSKWTPFR